MRGWLMGGFLQYVPHRRHAQLLNSVMLCVQGLCGIVSNKNKMHLLRDHCTLVDQVSLQNGS